MSSAANTGAVGQLVPRCTPCPVGQIVPPPASQPDAHPSPMQDSALFIHLILQLRSFADAAVLWAALREHADVQELRTTSTLISRVTLAETIDRKTVQRSFKRLEDLGLISMRVHSNTATHVTVDRNAVLALLSAGLDERLPGLDNCRDFPFLQAWAEDRKARHLAVA